MPTGADSALADWQAFLAHFNANKLFNEFETPADGSPKIRRFGQACAAAFGIALLVTGWIASAGFLTFGAASQGLVLNNYAVADTLAHLPYARACADHMLYMAGGRQARLLRAARCRALHRLLVRPPRPPSGAPPPGPTAARASCPRRLAPFCPLGTRRYPTQPERFPAPEGTLSTSWACATPRTLPALASYRGLTYRNRSSPGACLV